MPNVQRKQLDRNGRSTPTAGDILNLVVPALERAGFRVVPGTADDDGLVVTRGGRDCRIDLDLFAAPVPRGAGSIDTDAEVDLDEEDDDGDIPSEASWRNDDGGFWPTTAEPELTDPEVHE